MTNKIFGDGSIHVVQRMNANTQRVETLTRDFQFIDVRPSTLLDAPTAVVLYPIFEQAKEVANRYFGAYVFSQGVFNEIFFIVQRFNNGSGQIETLYSTRRWICASDAELACAPFARYDTFDQAHGIARAHHGAYARPLNKAFGWSPFEKNVSTRYIVQIEREGNVETLLQDAPIFWPARVEKPWDEVIPKLRIFESLEDAEQISVQHEGARVVSENEGPMNESKHFVNKLSEDGVRALRGAFKNNKVGLGSFIESIIGPWASSELKACSVRDWCAKIADEILKPKQQYQSLELEASKLFRGDVINHKYGLREVSCVENERMFVNVHLFGEAAVQRMRSTDTLNVMRRIKYDD